MPGYEYKVIPAPKKPGKIKGVRGTDLKFAASLSEIMNTLGRDGWEYQRTDTLPCEERQGLTGRTTTFQNMLVFRRSIDEPVEMSVRTPTVVTNLSHDALENQPERKPAAAQVSAPEVLSSKPSTASKAAPALAAATQDVPQGAAPKVNVARASEPDNTRDQPRHAAQ